MKQKGKSTRGPKPQIIDVEFTTGLDVEVCLQRLSACHQQPLFSQQPVDVLTTGNQFTVRLPVVQSASFEWFATCTGQLSEQGDDTCVSAKAESYQSAIQENQAHRVIFWVLWLIIVLSGAALATGDLRGNLALLVTLTGWFPVIMHANLTAEIRAIRTKTPNYGQWLYELLFEIDEAESTQAPSTDVQVGIHASASQRSGTAHHRN